MPDTAGLPLRPDSRNLPLRRPSETASGLKLHSTAADNKQDTDQQQAAACQAFEGFLLGEMLKLMREDGPSGQGVLPVSRAESVFLRQQSEALGEVLAQRQPLGIARLLQRSLDAQAAAARRGD